MKNALLCSALGAALLSTTASAQVINEFQPNPSGSDPATQTIEIAGTPGESFAGNVLTIDSDGTGDGFIGTVDRLTAFSGTFDANGLLTVEVDDLENPSITMVLTGDDATAMIGDDLDADGDGMLDSVASLGTVFDAINSPDSEGDFAVGYADQLGGTSMAFVGSEPVLVFRETTTGVLHAVDFAAVVYDQTGAIVDPSVFDLPPGEPTFGAVNPSITGVADTDGDGIGDDVDNCTLVANPDQLDTNGDLIGNICDGDLSNNCSISFEDLGLMKAVFFSNDPDADLSGNGSVSFEDLGLLKEAFFGPPGPSAAGCDAGS
ncbi:MAG: hypothetical protein AAFN78_14615 [Pseudomonadota bacterium]